MHPGRHLRLTLAGLAATLLATAGFAADAPSPDASYVHVKLDGEVDLGLAPLVKRAAEEARRSGRQGLFLEVNTFGGRMDAAVLIRDAVIDAGVPTTCWVNKRAISAGALICLAADAIDMAPGSTLGAATPVTIDPEGKMSAADEKVVSYLRKEFGATAEMKGRNRQIAEAMVDRDAGAEGLVEAGKLLTLTTDDALKHGIAARSSDSLDHALDAAGLSKSKRIAIQMNWAEKAARIVTHPVITGLLLLIATLGIVAEVKAPGHGVGGVVGLMALILFFAGHKVVLLAGWEDVGLVLLGIVLLALEIFVIPGFGIVGILGLASLVTGLVLAMVGHDVSDAAVVGTLQTALVTLSAAILGTGVALPLLVRWLPQTKFAQKTFVLADAIGAAGGTASYAEDLSPLVGRAAVARTVLRPAGVIVIGEDRHDAVSEGEVIEAGTQVTVVEVRGAQLVVRPSKTEA